MISESGEGVGFLLGCIFICLFWLFCAAIWCGLCFVRVLGLVVEWCLIVNFISLDLGSFVIWVGFCGGFVDGSEVWLDLCLVFQQEDDEMLVPHSEFNEAPQPMEGNSKSGFYGWLGFWWIDVGGFGGRARMFSLLLWFNFNETHDSGYVFLIWSIIYLVLVAPAEAAVTVENQQVEDPSTSRFTWTIENFSRLNVKKHYSDIFVVGGFKWFAIPPQFFVW